MTLIINLFDSNFSHLSTPDGDYSVAGHPNSLKKPKYIKYVRNKLEWDGITIFTDRFLNRSVIESVSSKYKIGWHLERIYGVPGDFETYCDLLDFTLTNDEILLSRYPVNTKFVPFGGGWIREENQRVDKKNKLVSIIYSSKTAHPGHRLRHQVARTIKGISLYGSGSPTPIRIKEDGLSEYMFSIVIENIKVNNYFTEKLIDSFLTGTVPIYWGCPNIGNFFDIDGMIIFNNIEELRTILDDLTPEKYNNNLDLINKNFELSKEYEIPEDWLYSKIFSLYENKT